jgi:hypothetical protein
VLNASPILDSNSNYGDGTKWLTPTQILNPRLAKFGVQLEF